MTVIKHQVSGLYLVSINEEEGTAEWHGDLKHAKKYKNPAASFGDWYTVSRCPDRKLIHMTNIVEESPSDASH